MFNFQSLIFIATSFIGLTTSLRCWTCENADISQCMRMGHWEECDVNEQACQSEVTYTKWKPMIRKTGCKQVQACVNNAGQNPAPAWHATQCNSHLESSVCRCCCTTNSCNIHLSNLLCEFPKDSTEPPLTTTLRDALANDHLPTYANHERLYSVVCDKLTEIPENGERKCTGNEAGATCTFECNSGYRREGAEKVECKATGNGAEWSDEIPSCIPFCESFPTTPRFGDLSCLGQGEIGTRCHFECNIGYELNGNEMLSCEMSENGARWNGTAPVCGKIPSCEPMPDSPSNGVVECSNEYGMPGTNCWFDCDVGFERHGSKITTCLRKGDKAEWSNHTPNCVFVKVCDSLGEIRHGKITCDDPKNNVGTTCRFECPQPSMRLYPKNIDSAVCNESTQWSNEKPCCVDCSKVKRDIVVALDSSDSITREEWPKIKNFVKSIIQKFKVSANETQFSVFTFSDAVDNGNIIPFNTPKYKLLKRVGKMKRLAQGTHFGKAFESASKIIRRNGKKEGRRSMMWIVTDGKPEDLKVVGDAAKELRQEDVEILTVAVRPTKLFATKMATLTGTQENVLEAQTMEGLTDDLVAKVTAEICDNECA